MNNVYKYILITTLLLSITLYSEDILIDKIACVVNKNIVTLRDIDRKLDGYAKANPDVASKIKTEEQKDSIRKKILDEIIDEELIRAELVKLKQKVTDKDVENTIDNIKKQNNLSDAEFRAALLRETNKSYEEYWTEIKSQLEKYKIMNIAIKPKVNVSKQDIEEYYKKNYTGKKGEPKVSFSVLFFETNNSTEEEKSKKKIQAEEILKRAKKGEDFSYLVRSYSDPGGGDTGFLLKKNLGKLFKDALSKLKVGEISNVIESKKGFYIIKFLDEGAEKTVTFEKVEGLIREKIGQQRMEEKFGEWLKDVRKKAFINIKI